MLESEIHLELPEDDEKTLTEEEDEKRPKPEENKR
jgi:hypothetical protein